MRNKLIAFIGVVGSGKTTAAKALIKNGFIFSGENYSSNSFLDKYYQEMKRWAFHSQMYFLVSKVKQYTEINSSLQHNNVVQDFPLFQDVAYAQTAYMAGNMTQEEWELYYDNFQLLNRKLKQPDLMVYLKVSPATAISRIQHRGREYEQGIDEMYLNSLQRSIEELFNKNTYRCKKIILNADKLNLVSSKRDIATFTKQIMSTIQK